MEALQGLYGALGVQIWKKVSGKIQIRIKLKGRIRIRIRVKGRIRIRIKVKSMTRIRIEVIWIRNTELSYTLWGTVYKLDNFLIFMWYLSREVGGGVEGKTGLVKLSAKQSK